jgi:hypothetical protein
MASFADLTPTLGAIGILMLITIWVLWASRADQYLAPAVAILRGAAQLAPARSVSASMSVKVAVRWQGCSSP